MTKKNGAMTIAEGEPDYKVDVNIVLNKRINTKDYVLRTTLDKIGVWKAKHSIPGSTFNRRVNGITKDASIIDNELWVFGVDACSASDIITSVRIATDHYKINARDIIQNVYVKNLNTEHENELEAQSLINANKNLYESTSNAIVEAARYFGVTGKLNIWVFSNNKNPKIPKEQLHQAFRNSNAKNVSTDSAKHKFHVKSNDGKRDFKNLLTNLHLAEFDL